MGRGLIVKQHGLELPKQLGVGTHILKKLKADLTKRRG